MRSRPTRRDPWPWVSLACALAFLVLGALALIVLTVAAVMIALPYLLAVVAGRQAARTAARGGGA
jgi:hypothetical protein